MWKWQRRMNSNPFARRLALAQARLEKLEKQQATHDASAVPGTYVTGGSGVSAAYKKRLNQQLDKTIDLAVAIVAQRRKVAELAQSVQMYDQGKINAQGRSISPTRQVVRSVDQALKRLLVAEMRQTYLHMEIDGFATFRGHTLEVLIDPVWGDKKADPKGIIRQTTPDGSVVDHIAQSIQGFHLEATAYTVMRQIEQGQIWLLTNGS